MSELHGELNPEASTVLPAPSVRPTETRIGAVKTPRGALATVFFVASAVGAGVMLIIGIKSWRLGLPKPLAVFPILLCAMYLAALPFWLVQMRKGTEVVLRDGVIWTRCGRREKKLIVLSDVRELLLWRSDIPGLLGSGNNDPIDALVFLKARWDALPGRVHRSLRQAPTLVWRHCKCIPAGWVERSLTDLAHFLASEAQRATGDRLPIFVFSNEDEPTPIMDNVEIEDWRDVPSESLTTVRAGFNCVSCGYDLRGARRQDRCPECGTPISRTLEGCSLHAGEPEWLTRIGRGAGLAATAGLAASLMTALLFTLAAHAPQPIPAGYFPLRLAWMGLCLALVLVVVGGWFLTSPETPDHDQHTRKLRRFSRLIWVFPLAVALLLWLCGAPPRLLAMGGAAAALAPCGKLVLVAGALLGRGGLRKWSLWSFAGGRFATFIGFMIPFLIGNTYISGAIKKVVPAWAAGGAVVPAAAVPPPAVGGPRPIDRSLLLKGLIFFSGPVFLASMGAALWAPVLRLWYEIRLGSAELRPAAAGARAAPGAESRLGGS